MGYTNFGVVNNGHNNYIIKFKDNGGPAILSINNLNQIMHNHELIELIDKYYGMIDKTTIIDKIVFLDRKDGENFLEEFLIYYNMYLLRGDVK